MTTKPLGLICAIPDEIAHFGASFVETSTRTLAGLTFREGTLEELRAATGVESLRDMFFKLSNVGPALAAPRDDQPRQGANGNESPR